jgi:hypothetical protein
VLAPKNQTSHSQQECQEYRKNQPLFHDFQILPPFPS